MKLPPIEQAASAIAGGPREFRDWVCRLLLLIVAPFAASAAEPGILRAGAATSNITPPLGISLASVIGNQGGVARHVHDELWARCLVLDDGHERIAIVICDSAMISRELFDRAKRMIRDETGLPANRMVMAATHTHNAPRPLWYLPAVWEIGYPEFVARRIADGVRRAINLLAPARIGWGAGRKPDYVFNRRWLMRPGSRLPNPFGEATDRVQTNAPRASELLVRPAGEVDPEIGFLSVQHADGRPLALLANYGLHYVGGVGGNTVSADYSGAFADRIQQLLAADRQEQPFIGIMSNGASGDVNANDRTKPAASEPEYARIRKVADGVATEVHRVRQSIKHRSDVSLAMEESELELGIRRPGPERLQWAGNPSKDPKWETLRNRSDVYVRETLALADWPPTMKVKLQAIRIGELGIAAIPCEVFAATGLEIKSRSPLPQAFTISLANGYEGYLPRPADHELGGYETWNARSSCLEIEASEKIRDEILRLLQVVADWR